MNIKITHSWLLEYLQTTAEPPQIQQLLSLSGPSVERVTVEGNETVYDIEITSNRIDTASVQGIAREAYAILPQAGLQAEFATDPVETPIAELTAPKDKWVELNLSISDQTLAPRALAVVLSVDPSRTQVPQYMKDRLTAIGLRSISPVIDITNYLMVECGQPLHAFDYDAFEKGVQVLRLSRKGERVTTLDETQLTLPEGVIVIEDARGTLQDLCGIMGGFSSRVTSQTKRIILFVQTYDKTRIRSAVMRTGKRTLAATYFEKGLDQENVLPTFKRAISLLARICSAQIISSTVDIQSPQSVPQPILLSHTKLESRIGMTVTAETVTHILTRLGFSVSTDTAARTYSVLPPSFRRQDITEDVDLIEEVARIVGYHVIPSAALPAAIVSQPVSMLRQYQTAQTVRTYLKHQGGIELINYSAISRSLLETFGLSTSSHLSITNSISEDFTYLRTTLIPGLVQNYQKNRSQSDTKILLFEVGNIYLPTETDLPQQNPTLAVLSNDSIETIKAMLFGVCAELRIGSYGVHNAVHPVLHEKISGVFKITDMVVGHIGMLSPRIQEQMGIPEALFVAQLSLNLLPEQGLTGLGSYRKPNPYAVIKQHLTLPYTAPYAQIEATMRQKLSHVQSVTPLSRYKDKITVEILFNKPDSNLTEKEVLQQLELLEF